MVRAQLFEQLRRFSDLVSGGAGSSSSSSTMASPAPGSVASGGTGAATVGSTSSSGAVMPGVGVGALGGERSRGTGMTLSLPKQYDISFSDLKFLGTVGEGSFGVVRAAIWRGMQVCTLLHVQLSASGCR
jgi:hypothetical protein